MGQVTRYVRHRRRKLYREAKNGTVPRSVARAAPLKLDSIQPLTRSGLALISPARGDRRQTTGIASRRRVRAVVVVAGGATRPRVLGRLAPLAISMIPRALIRDGRGAIWREAGLLQHSPKIHDDLCLDILTMRRREHLRLWAERDLELAIVLVRHGSNRLEQRHDLAPLDVAARRMAEDPFDRVAMMTAEVRFHLDPFVGIAVCP